MLKLSLGPHWLMPLILKCIQVIAGIVCIVFAAKELKDNIFNLVVDTVAAFVGNQADDITDGQFLKTLLSSIKGEHIFVDQLTCRLIFLAVTSILLIFSLVQLIWYSISIYTGLEKSRIISFQGVIYHLIGFASHVGVSVNLLVTIDLLKGNFYSEKIMRNVVNVGLVIAVAYLLSAITALLHLRGSMSCCHKSRFQEFHHISLKRLEEG